MEGDGKQEFNQKKSRPTAQLTEPVSAGFSGFVAGLHFQPETWDSQGRAQADPTDAFYKGRTAVCLWRLVLGKNKLFPGFAKGAASTGKPAGSVRTISSSVRLVRRLDRAAEP